MNESANFEHPFLNGMDEQNRWIFLNGAAEQEFAPGEIIFREGEPANTLYLIKSGQVAIEATAPGAEPTDIQILSSGEVLGWSWLFPPFAWHFQARALQPTTVICCDGGRLLVEAEENPAFGYDLMRRISQIVIRRLQTTRQRLLKWESVLGRETEQVAAER